MKQFTQDTSGHVTRLREDKEQILMGKYQTAGVVPLCPCTLILYSPQSPLFLHPSRHKPLVTKRCGPRSWALPYDYVSALGTLTLLALLGGLSLNCWPLFLTFSSTHSPALSSFLLPHCLFPAMAPRLVLPRPEPGCPFPGKATWPEFTES